MMRVSANQLGFGVALILAGFASGTAWSQSQDKEKIVAERQELMKQQGRELVAVRNFFQGKGEQAAATAGVEALKKSLPTVVNYFPPGTGPGEVTAKTRAKPEVWKEHDKFVAADKQVAAQIATLDEAVKSGDKQRIETVFNEIKFCDACHATFRAPAQ